MSKNDEEDWENEGGKTLASAGGTVRARPTEKLWGNQTKRAIKHFDIGNDYFDHDFISVLITIKMIMAESNQNFGLIDPVFSKAIIKAGKSLLEKEDFSHFPTKIWQSGSGTNINMNVNEVIATFANALLKKNVIHPNDHVNMSQSSNDVIPTALNIISMKLVIDRLIPQLYGLELELGSKVESFKDIIKVGRTHMMDAVPMSLGQEFSAFQDQIKENRNRIKSTLDRLKLLALGGTAIGTGINCPSEVSNYAIKKISETYDIPFEKRKNLFSGISSSDSVVELSGQLKTLACSLLKIATDIIVLSSGPDTGIGEFNFPNNEKGSSIMPGKINPTQCEALSMVCCQVIGNDTAITLGGMQGKLQLNTFRPLLIKNIIHSINLLSDSMRSFNEHCLKGLRENSKNIERNLSRSKMIITAISSNIGYDKAASLAQCNTDQKKSMVREIVGSGILTEQELKKRLDPRFMIHPPPLKRKF